MKTNNPGAKTKPKVTISPDYIIFPPFSTQIQPEYLFKRCKTQPPNEIKLFLRTVVPQILNAQSMKHKISPHPFRFLKITLLDQAFIANLTT